MYIYIHIHRELLAERSSASVQSMLLLLLYDICNKTYLYHIFGFGYVFGFGYSIRIMYMI